MRAPTTAYDALDRLPDGVVLADDKVRVTAANAAAERLLETTVEPGALLSDVVRLQDLQGNDWLTCADPYGGLALRSGLVESSWWSVSGREVLVTVRLQRNRPAGSVTGVALCLRSAHARELGDRSRSDLVATVAHELRSPLTGVKGFTSTLISKWDRLTDDQKLLMLATVDADADRLTRLITELLDVARIDVGRLSVRKEPTPLVPLVSSLVGRMVAPAGRVVRIDVEGDPRVWVDRDRLAQVVVNLVENAFAHGDGDVMVCLREVDQGGAEIVVSDEGPGIPDEIRPRIFTKFWRQGADRGSGLGLFIVAGLVAAHDGSVIVESGPRQGARLRVVLPHGAPYRPETG